MSVWGLTMKGKTTVKGTKKTPTAAVQGSRNGNDTGYAPAVPISVYRELAKELDNAKQELSTVTAQNAHLQKQNKALRQEVIRVIQSAAALKDILQPPQVTTSPTPSPASMPLISQVPTMPSNAASSDRVSEDLIAELDRSLAVDIGPSLNTQATFIAPNGPDGVIQGPFCELVTREVGENNGLTSPVVTEPLFTEQSTTPPNAIALEDEKKSGFLSGIWLPLTLVFVIVTAFSAGFLIMLAFNNANQAK